MAELEQPPCEATAFWSQQLGRPVSSSEAEEIEANLVALVELLIEDEREKGTGPRA